VATASADPRVVNYPEGRWRLIGSSASTDPHYWVWVPTGVPIAPAEHDGSRQARFLLVVKEDRQMVRRILIGGITSLLLIGLPGQGHARVSVNIGINLPAPPQLVPVPATPVMYAPAVGANYFFYGSDYYVFANGGWYVSRGHNGPWILVAPEFVPRPILMVPVQYYRVPPPAWKDWRRDAAPRWEPHCQSGLRAPSALLRRPGVKGHPSSLPSLATSGSWRQGKNGAYKTRERRALENGLLLSLDCETSRSDSAQRPQ
jgi:hypothetical protein